MITTNRRDLSSLRHHFPPTPSPIILPLPSLCTTIPLLNLPFKLPTPCTRLTLPMTLHYIPLISTLPIINLRYLTLNQGTISILKTSHHLPTTIPTILLLLIVTIKVLPSHLHLLLPRCTCIRPPPNLPIQPMHLLPPATLIHSRSILD
uniref:Uncharacterized protein n=1 Tax=Cacopsylla melanoneura TaxID=428564 RepID=A0A8D8Y1X7_9HEMI